MADEHLSAWLDSDEVHVAERAAVFQTLTHHLTVSWRRHVPPSAQAFRTSARAWLLAGDVESLVELNGDVFTRLEHGGPLDASLVRKIARDVPRTGSLASSAASCEALGRVLRGFALFNPRIGYCQGMNNVAAVCVLATSGDAERAFWLFAGLMRRFGGLFSPGLAGFNRCMAVLGELVSVHVGAALQGHLALHGVKPEMYGSAMLHTLFTHDSVAPALRTIAWDMLFATGPAFSIEPLLRLVLGTVIAREWALLACKDDAELLRVLRSAGDDADCGAIVLVAQALPLCSAALCDLAVDDGLE